MKTQLVLSPHSMIEGANVIEVWHDGKLVGTVTGADGPGVRVISKYPIVVTHGPRDAGPRVANCRIKVET